MTLASRFESALTLSLSQQGEWECHNGGAPYSPCSRSVGRRGPAQFSGRCSVLFAVALLTGCDLSMTQQPKYKPYAPSKFWGDGSSARPLPAGTVAQGDLARRNEEKTQPKVSAALLSRGQRSYDTFCSPCHGLAGYGDGMIVQRGFPPPPSYHIDRLRAVEIRHFYDVATNGYGVMYSYAGRIPAQDRWAIAAYIRALQLSQHATVAVAPEAAEKVK